jgi:signal transduction histidine kinase
MNRLIKPAWRRLFTSGFLLLLPCWWETLIVNAGQYETEPKLATNILMLRSEITREAGRILKYDINGTILSANFNSRMLFFQDNSGTALLNVNLRGEKLQSGQKIRLCGTNYVAYTDIGLSFGTSPVVDNDKLHPTREIFREIYLKAGPHPLRVTWFNRTAEYFLQVDYSGPHIPQQTIPTAALFREDNTSGAGNLLPGLYYRCFEGQWDELPDFDSLVSQRAGIVSNFDIKVKTQDENVGLEFTGFLVVPEDGIYKFYLSSDDGSQLFLDNAPPIISILGTAPLPAPQPVTVSQLLPDSPDCLWAETEGTITFMSQGKNHVEFDLAASEKKMRVELLCAPSEIPRYLLNSRVQLRGICPVIKNGAGQKYAGMMVVADWRDLRVLDVAPDQWSALKSSTIGELNRRFPAGGSGIANLQGRLQFDQSTHTMRFEDASGSASIELMAGGPTENRSNIECLSRWNWDGTNLFLHEAVAREFFSEFGGEAIAPNILTTALQVQRLTRAEAEREYPVKIEGVVTSISDQHRDFVIQDSTRAVYVMAGDNFLSNFPSVGDYCEIEGVSRPADFSPIVALREVKILWRGQMPTPINPTRDQLISGSLDAQYVEVRGLVIATHDTYLTLLTADGTLNLDVSSASGGQLEAYLNSIISVRGCFFANWDPSTHRVILDQPIHIHEATVSIDSPPPTDLFEADKVHAKDLMQFDVRFDPFRRVKVGGQIIHCSADMGYLMDNGSGLRFRLVQPLPLLPGDEVEVVGLLEPGGTSPLLGQAVARKSGHLPLPEPRQISLNSLSNNYDVTLVCVEGTLVDLQKLGDQQTLELQTGLKSFIARLDTKQDLASFWPLGSRLKLTGTFCALDGDRLAGSDVNSFELLLNSPTDVQVIARPSWWTLTHLLMAIACLLAGLTMAFVWITMLREQVDRRTLQLEREISERERAEKLRAIEQERSRIARDLHDDLGSTLTEISMMATANPGLKMESETASSRLREIAEKSRSMVSALDGVVWVINSKNDTLSSLVEYLASYAEEFLAKAGIAYRVELPRSYANCTIVGEIRHDVMLAVREAINNAVRHGNPNEVLLRLTVTGDQLEILVQDDGCGFNPALIKGNGLDNLKERMSKLNGSCQINSSFGTGTSITLKVTLPKLVM